MDGTGGRRGWRSASEGAVGAPFPEPRSYLAPAEAATYDTWTAWSQKPAGLDHLLPSLDYFSLGKTQPFLGDVNQPGVIERLIKVQPSGSVMRVGSLSAPLGCSPVRVQPR
jgi:hypothetical protein